MSAKAALLIGLLLIGAAFFGIFLGTIGHGNKTQHPSSEAPSQMAQNPSPAQNASLSTQYSNATR